MPALWGTLFCILFIFSTQVAADTRRLGPDLDIQAKIVQTDHGAEVLYSLTEVELKADGHWQAVDYISIRINSIEAARDYGRIAVPYNHYYSNISLDFARVLDRQGKLNELAEDAVQVRITGGGQDFYSDSSELVFSLPDVAPGSILEFQYTHTSKELALPELFSNRITPYYFQKKVGNDGWRTDYVSNFSYSLTHNVGKKLYTKSYNHFPATPTVKSDGRTITKTWSMKNVKDLTIEGWMPPLYQVAPQLFISTHKDWSVIDTWSWGNVHEKLVPTAETKKIAKRLKTKKHGTDDEKVRAVYEFIQSNIRYVFAHLGRGGYEPHFPNDVLQQNYGDCKDQTVLTVTLLKELGVEAYPALVQTPQSGRSDTPLVSLIFDHMIVYIPATETREAIWLDTTGDRALYPGMSGYLAGQTAFVVDGKGGKLTRIPKSKLPNNEATLNLDYRVNEEGFSEVSAEIFLSGYYEENIRNWWKHDTNRTTSLNQFASSIFPKTTEYVFSGDVLNTDDFWQPATIKGVFTFKEKASEEDSVSFAASLAQIIQLFGGYSELQLPQERENRFTNFYPSTLYLNANFHAPTETIVAVVDTGSDIKSNYFTFTQKGSKTAEGYRVTMSLTRPVINISAREYAEYFEHAKALSQPNPWIISFTNNPEQEKEHQLSQVESKFGNKSFEFLLAKTKQLIEAGNFEAALEPAQEAVKLNVNSGEAWYYLGMAQGLNSMIDESQQSFTVAETLGYLP
ncbi:DUF3857 domain-containing protein [Teredinibacter sp. KSP-S5-2]|uniref:DUF3857 domain-containing protein n=1 Tax=Teredinibacter sp. KSP-S5-2 TaxID=3034506 RepID=UPI002934ED75|nr:DUF3857 domain-containing protein [Teredinibacter sp. KSP-S5-2]WNO10196.1 DUF3857 domain-containing protein [Teredinibacter sp. KSP-S5-2]